MVYEIEMAELSEGPFANILHQDALRRLSGQKTFERGVSYQREGRVTDLARKDASLSAVVRGAASYAVRLWVHEKGLAFSCSCPQGQESTFCKHAVAVALGWLSQAGVSASTPRAEVVIVGATKADLVRALEAEAVRDPTLLGRIAARITAHRGE